MDSYFRFVLKEYDSKLNAHVFNVVPKKEMTLKELCDELIKEEEYEELPKIVFRVITKFSSNSGDDFRTIEAEHKREWRYTVGSLFLEQYGNCNARPIEVYYANDGVVYTLSIAEAPAAEIVPDGEADAIIVPVTVTKESIHKTLISLLKTEVVDTWFDKLKEDCAGHTLEFELGYRTALNTGLRALLNYRTKLWEAADESQNQN